MLGLEYILEEFGMSKAELAEKLKIDRANITMWLSGVRPIPKKHLPKLVAIFNLPENYFCEQIDKERKLEIQNVKLTREYYNVEDTIIDELGDEVTTNRYANDSIDVIEMNNVQIGYVKSLKRLQKVMNVDINNHENIGYAISEIDEHTKVINLFSEIMESQNTKNEYLLQRVLNAVLIHLNERKGIGRLYKFEDDDFVKQLVKLLEREEGRLKTSK